ncbi:Transcription factor grauzone [Pseudolycoriella hygida]|uniref:Transcription factor grauzone n=1 Tax=Pseudolycoriella hygida TaxID=35572 RepID=A0A9Q0MLQ4_9DIPT|nr:Transcription factor grauzone [Pseudolycoriella hygida]
MNPISNQLCRLCLERTDDVVNVFDKFQGSTIASILTQHFWFQVCKYDGYSEYLCEICWINTKTFHNFYKRVERRQKNFSHLAKVETHSIKEEPSDDPMLESDLILFKNEVTDPPVTEFQLPKESDDLKPDPNEHVKMEIDIGDTSVTENSTIASNPIEFEEERDLDEFNQNGDFSGMTVKEKNEKIREFFDMSCQICSETFETFGKIKKHYRTAHTVAGYVHCCGRKFHGFSRALNHIFHHLNPDAYRCDICDKRFPCKHSLQRHMRDHVPAYSALVHKCEICKNRIYKTAACLTQHMRLKHSPDEDKKFHCQQCSKKFLSQPLLNYHIRIDHNLEFTQVCDICARVFKDKNTLRVHMKSHSTITPEKVQCTICGAWLKHERGLRNHIKRHQTDSGAECSICKKVLKNKPSLDNHIRHAHGERRHHCTFCEKKFKTPHLLREHIAGHTGQDLYECAHCPKTFKSSANMFSHRKKMHFEEWMQSRKKGRIVEQTITKQDSEKLDNSLQKREQK